MIVKKLYLSAVILYYSSFAGLASAQSLDNIYNECMSSEGRITGNPQYFQPNPQSYCAWFSQITIMEVGNLVDNPPACLMNYNSYNLYISKQGQCKRDDWNCHSLEREAQACLASYPLIKWVPF